MTTETADYSCRSTLGRLDFSAKDIMLWKRYSGSESCNRPWNLLPLTMWLQRFASDLGLYEYRNGLELSKLGLIKPNQNWNGLIIPYRCMTYRYADALLLCKRWKYRLGIFETLHKQWNCNRVNTGSKPPITRLAIDDTLELMAGPVRRRSVRFGTYTGSGDKYRAYRMPVLQETALLRCHEYCVQFYDVLNW